MTKRLFVTGAAGCIGAWLCKASLERGWQPIAADIDERYHRWRDIMTTEEMSEIPAIKLDITDHEALSKALETTGADQIIHTAALQVPFNRADPVRGALVNVVGTVNVFEATRKHDLGPVVYASSVAVFGAADDYETDILPGDALPNPSELYGVNKVCNEGTASVYWEQHGVASVGLRPHTVYGPGRDAGMTSAPTKAILAAAAGEQFHIGYGGRSGFQYVEDVADIMLMAADRQGGGADVFGICGQVRDMAEFVATIHRTFPGSEDLITHDSNPLSLPAGMDDSALREALGDVPDRSLRDGILATAEVLSRAELS